MLTKKIPEWLANIIFLGEAETIMRSGIKFKLALVQVIPRGACDFLFSSFVEEGRPTGLHIVGFHLCNRREKARL